MNRLTRPKVVALGEVLWDEYAGGAELGGAPANFAAHCAALGAEAQLVSRVGEDARGAEALRLLAQRGVGLVGVTRDPLHPTGRVGVELRGGIPRFQIHENVAWDFLEFIPPLSKLAREAEIVYFGTLAQRSRASRSVLERFLDLCPETTRVVLDLNLRAPFYDRRVVRGSLARADLLKLSDEEWPVLRAMLGGRRREGEFLARLREDFNLEVVVLTRGAEGCRIVGPQGDFEVAGEAVEAMDTVGAGDAFTAAFALAWHAGRPLPECGQAANALAAFVCTRSGAVPELPERFRFFPTPGHGDAGG